MECLASANWSPVPFCSGKLECFIQMSGPQSVTELMKLVYVYAGSVD